jgi:hypothetical protein
MIDHDDDDNYCTNLQRDLNYRAPKYNNISDIINYHHSH